MKERINKLARGIVDLACPELRLSDTAFHGMVCAGETLKLDLTLTSENGILLKGLIYSDSPYVTLQKNTFLGLRTRISALVDARALEDGDHIEGGLCIVSNRNTDSVCLRGSFLRIGRGDSGLTYAGRLCKAVSDKRGRGSPCI